MAIFKENIDVVNPEGSDGNNTRKSEVTFYGFLSTDASLNDAFTGIGDTIYTDADNSNPLNDATFGGVFHGSGNNTPTFTVEIDSTGTPDTFKFQKLADGVTSTILSGVDITGSAQTLQEGVTITFSSTTGHSIGDQWQTTMLATTTEAHQMTRFTTVHEGTGTDHKSSLAIAINNDGYPSDTIFSGDGLNDATFGGQYDSKKQMIRTIYYVKIDSVGGGTGGVDTFSWSKDNFSTFEATSVDITGAAQTLDSGINITFAATTGHTLNNSWRAIIYDDAIKIFSNNLVKFSGDFVQSGGTVSTFKVYSADGDQLNVI